MAEPILVPFYNRPELLWLTLESLGSCDAIKEHDVELATYEGYDAECMDVAEEWADLLGARSVRIHVAARRLDLTRNILESVKRLTPAAGEYLVIIEEDVRVTPDGLVFLRDAWRTHGREDVFAVNGYVREADEGPSGTEDQAEAVEWYSPYAVLLPRPTLDLIVPHCREEYYSRRGLYVDSIYPPARLGYTHPGAYNQQAGLLQRLRAKHRPYVLRPRRSRAQHMGYWQSHRRCPHRGDLQERVTAVREVLENRRDYISQRWRNVNDYAVYRSEGYACRTYRLTSPTPAR